MGDNMVLPHGESQHFYPSIKIRLKPQKVHDYAKEVKLAYQEVSGTIAKNKTAPPKKEFTTHLTLQNYSIFKKGTFNNTESIIKYLRRSNTIKIQKKKWVIDIEGVNCSASGKEELAVLIEADNDLYNLLYEVTLEQEINGY